MKNWQNNIDISGATAHHNLFNSGVVALLKESLNSSDTTILQDMYQGSFKCGYKNLIKKIKSLGGKEIFKSHFHSNTQSSVFFFPKGVVIMYHNSDTDMTIQFCMADDNDFKKLSNFLEKNYYSEVNSNTVYVITSGMAGSLNLTEVGIGAQKLERNNYSTKVLKSFDKIISDLCSKSPSGRISILEGPPGTGKTFLIKGILFDAPDAICVMVPSNMIGELGGPSLLPVLMQAKQYGNNNSPIILILEDADIALRDRKDTDFGTISTLLNLGDGILGGLLDLRILATTNANELEMDKAIIRSGRLSQRMTVGELAAKHANRVLGNLLGKKVNKFKKPTILADVYKEAKKLGWTPPQIEQGSSWADDRPLL